MRPSLQIFSNSVQLMDSLSKELAAAALWEAQFSLSSSGINGLRFYILKNPYSASHMTCVCSLSMCWQIAYDTSERSSEFQSNHISGKMWWLTLVSPLYTAPNSQHTRLSWSRWHLSGFGVDIEEQITLAGMRHIDNSNVSKDPIQI